MALLITDDNYVYNDVTDKGIDLLVEILDQGIFTLFAIDDNDDFLEILNENDLTYFYLGTEQRICIEVGYLEDE